MIESVILFFVTTKHQRKVEKETHKERSKTLLSSFEIFPPVVTFAI